MIKRNRLRRIYMYSISRQVAFSAQACATGTGRKLSGYSFSINNHSQSPSRSVNRVQLGDIWLISVP